MSTIYSLQLGGVQSAGFGTTIKTSFFVAEPPYTWVVREIAGFFIFGSDTDAFEVGLLPGGFAPGFALVSWDSTIPRPVIQPVRLVLDPGDELYYLSTSLPGSPMGGFVVSGYRLTPP